jgi:hypothetical protein
MYSLNSNIIFIIKNFLIKIFNSLVYSLWSVIIFFLLSFGYLLHIVVLDFLGFVKFTIHLILYITIVDFLNISSLTSVQLSYSQNKIVDTTIKVLKEFLSRFKNN